MIPLKLETLLEGRVVEQDRIEYKKGWNPSDIMHTICAFANDFHNMNGGYIVIGIDEKNGKPILPPEGVSETKLDAIQKELFQYCNLINPRYIPQLEIVNFDGKYLLYLWCSAGQNDPYQVSVDVYGKDKSKKEYYIKAYSVKTQAKGPELFELFDKFNTVPFDDRVNREAKISDIRRSYVEDYLRDSNSSLVVDINNRTVESLLKALEVADEVDGNLDIRNIGILMFSEHPEKFFPGAQINLVRFHTAQAESSDDFTEKTFIGPIHKQIRDVLNYIDTTLIEEKVVKVSGRAKADRFYNYPYDALEEAIVNAVFHKSYLQQDPVEIRIYIDCIKILNYPGPQLWIDMDKMKEGKVLARRYRNRRIGEFLKDIDLTEKQSTGISKIIRVLKENGSSLPEFETNDRRDYIITTFKMHKEFIVTDKMSDKMSDKEKVFYEIVTEYLKENQYITNADAVLIAKVSAPTVRRYLGKLCEYGLLESEGKNKGKKYYLT